MVQRKWKRGNGGGLDVGGKQVFLVIVFSRVPQCFH